MFSEKLLRYIEPATLVTVIIGAIYLVGWSFSLSYYNRLNIHSYFYDFTPLYYLKMAFLPIYISGFFLAISLLGKFNNTKRSAFRRNLIFLFGGMSIIVLGIRMDILFFIISGVLILLIFIYFSMKKHSMFGTSNKLPLLIIFFFICIIFAGVLGDITAQNHVESKRIIVFDWKGESPKEIVGKDLVLIDIREGNYCVVERQKTVNEQSEVYLIPKDQIEFATLKNLKTSIHQDTSNSTAATPGVLDKI